MRYLILLNDQPAYVIETGANQVEILPEPVYHRRQARADMQTWLQDRRAAVQLPADPHQPTKIDRTPVN